MGLLISESDTKLLDRDLSINDPTVLEGLVSKICPDDKLENVLFRYDVAIVYGRSASRVHCAHCNAPRHHKGWVVELNEGRKALIGKDCGHKQFELDFKHSENNFKSLEARKNNLMWLQEAAIRIKETSRRYNSLLREPSFTHYNDFMRQLRKEHGQLSQRLGQMLREYPGNLTALIKVRDHQREDARIDQERKSRKLSGSSDDKRLEKELKQLKRTLPPIYRSDPKHIAQCLGSAALNPSDPLQIAKSAAAGLSALADKINGSASETWDKHSFLQAKREEEGLMLKMLSAIEQVNSLADFMSPINLGRIQRLFEADSELCQTYKVQGSSIVKILDSTFLCLHQEYREIALNPPPAQVSRTENQLSAAATAA